MYHWRLSRPNADVTLFPALEYQNIKDFVQNMDCHFSIYSSLILFSPDALSFYSTSLWSAEFEYLQLSEVVFLIGHNKGV